MLRVLVVDDEALIRWCLAELLAEAGYAVVPAPDAATARSSLKDSPRPFDVVLLDFLLPDSTDLTLVADIRRQSPTSAIILMTAFATPEVITRAEALGVRDVLHKPFDMDNIEALVLAAVQSRQQTAG